MSNNIIIILSVVLLGPCVVYSILRMMRDNNISTLDENIKEVLVHSDKVPISIDEKDHLKRHNRKRMLIFSAIFFLLISACCIMAIFHQVTSVWNIVVIGIVIFFALNFVLIILTWTDNRKLKTNHTVYAMKCYVRKVYIYNGTHVILIYYDYLQKKYVSKRVMLNTNETENTEIEEDSFLEILVQEQSRNLNYISIRF